MSQSWRELLDEFGVYRPEPCLCKGCKLPATHQLYEYDARTRIKRPNGKVCDRHYAYWQKATS
jgi:hypothetical protein